MIEFFPVFQDEPNDHLENKKLFLLMFLRYQSIVFFYLANLKENVKIISFYYFNNYF